VFVSLDNEIAGQIMLLAKTYPHHTSETSDTPGVHPEEGGEAPTVALLSSTTSN
jgi:hypothetical protein